LYNSYSLFVSTNVKLQQLKYVCEIVNAGFNLSRAARALHSSQPGVSRYIHLLEEELGVKLFERAKNRFTALTPAGSAIAEAAKRALREVETVQHIARDFRSGDVGNLTIATAPGHARYSLPPVIERYVKRHPRVRLRIRQGNSGQVVEWVMNREADCFIATGPTEPNRDLTLLPCHEIHTVIMTPPSHPLGKKRRITLEDVCAYPIITYNAEFSFYTHMMKAFHTEGLEPDILLSAGDAELMKTYVRAGLGIAIVAHTAQGKRKDRGIRPIDAAHLFGTSIVHIGVPRGVHLSRHLVQFIEMFAPHVDLARYAARIVPAP
jgi:LysR family cys regulon transcriptional activator